MQIMQNDTVQPEVIIGQNEPTKEFGVSDDPMLMSMLSTGFYANPHRTMIQEIMFNAWDAHVAGGITDRPIEIHISDALGLTIRDYGPGIPHNEMHDRYCIYGHSTKRADSDQTGGFGLGCKSPFAYTTSFTVLSHNNDMRSTYFISKASEDVNGKPGITTLVSTPTDQTGLQVMIPLEEGDIRNTKSYILDVLFLSGIKATVKFISPHGEGLEEPIKQEDWKTLAPDEYKRRTDQIRGLYAVYGGVSYAINEHDEYSKEMRQLKTFYENGSLHIGFAANSLTPLPNREGLSMSPRTVQNIKESLQRCIANIHKTFLPLLEMAVIKTLKQLKKEEVEVQFILYYLMVGPARHRFKLESDIERPAHLDRTMWLIGDDMMRNQIRGFIALLTRDVWNSTIIRLVCDAYPGYSEAYTAIGGMTAINSGNAHQVMDHLLNIFFRDFTESHEKFQKDMGDTNHSLRLRRHTTWQKATIITDKKATNPIPVLATRNNKNITELFIHKTIILARTVQSLKDTGEEQNKFTQSPLHHNVHNAIGYHGRDHSRLVGYVVGGAKENYVRARDLLKAQGFKVIEGLEPDPEEVKKRSPQLKHSSVYDQIDVYSHNEMGKKDLADPTHYLYLKPNENMTNKSVISAAVRIFPKTAIVRYKGQVDALKKMGAIPIKDAIYSWFKELCKDRIYMRNLLRYRFVVEHTCLNTGMLQHPTFLKLFSIKPGDETFHKNYRLLETIIGNSMGFLDIIEIKKELSAILQGDPKSNSIRKLCLHTKLFYPHMVNHLWEKANSQRRDTFAKNFSHFIRNAK